MPGPDGHDLVAVDSCLREGGDRVDELFFRLEWLLSQAKDGVVRMMLPDGYPASVTSDYLEYSLWRSVQGIASQVSGVLSTQVRMPGQTGDFGNVHSFFLSFFEHFPQERFIAVMICKEDGWNQISSLL